MAESISLIGIGGLFYIAVLIGLHAGPVIDTVTVWTGFVMGTACVVFALRFFIRDFMYMKRTSIRENS